MATTMERRASPRRVIVRALLAGLALLVLLFPWAGGVTTDPPTCYGLFGPFWMVPCDGVVALTAGGIMAGAVLLASALVRHGPGWWARIALAALAALTMVALQLSSFIRDLNPPICTGYFGHWTVPCGWWPPVAMGAVTGILVLLALSLDELSS